MSTRIPIQPVAANTAGGAIANVDLQEVAALAAAVIRLCPLFDQLVAAGLTPPDNFSALEWRIFRLNPLAVGMVDFSLDVADAVTVLPIVGATVFVTDADGSTDQADSNESGTARFPNDPTPTAFVAGDGFFRATAPGYFDYPISGQAEPTTPLAIAQGLSFPFQMAPTGAAQTFDFVVTNSVGAVPIDGALCRIEQNGVEVFRGFTGVDGHVTVPLGANVLAGSGSHVVVSFTGFDDFDVFGWDVTIAQPFPVGLVPTV